MTAIAEVGTTACVRVKFRKLSTIVDNRQFTDATGERQEAADCSAKKGSGQSRSPLVRQFSERRPVGSRSFAGLRAGRFRFNLRPIQFADDVGADGPRDDSFGRGFLALAVGLIVGGAD